MYKTEYAKYKCSQEFSELVSCFGPLSRVNNLQHYKFQRVFRRDEHLKRYIWEQRFQKLFSSPQNVKKNFYI